MALESLTKSTAQRQSEKAAKREAEHHTAEAEAYWAGPLGQAVAAKHYGQGFFQFEMPINQVWGNSAYGSAGGNIHGSGGRPDLLSQIEAIGWKLEHVGYVYVQTGSASTNHFLTTGQGSVTYGTTMGIYLFRNV